MKTSVPELLGFALSNHILRNVGWVEVRNPTMQIGLNPTYQNPDFSLVRNGKLEISHNNWNLRPTALDFFITVKALKGVAISGSGDINGKDRFVLENLYADVSGSGDIFLELEATQLNSDRCVTKTIRRK